MFSVLFLLTACANPHAVAKLADAYAAVPVALAAQPALEDAKPGSPCRCDKAVASKGCKCANCSGGDCKCGCAGTASTSNCKCANCSGANCTCGCGGKSHALQAAKEGGCPCGATCQCGSDCQCPTKRGARQL